MSFVCKLFKPLIPNSPVRFGKIRGVIVVATLIMLLSSPATFISTSAQTDDDPFARIEAALVSSVEHDIFSGAILIASDGEILLEKGYGYAVREWEVPNTPESVFLIASLTKQFTAMAVLLLQERGLLTVQDPICQYIEDCPEAWSEITIHHLLNHTSGIPDFIGFPDFRQTQTMSSRPLETIERFRDKPLAFVPGEDWYYSNSGYIVLGYIIEEVSGDSYQTFLRQNIFEPLGMQNTGYPSARRIVEHWAQGYSNARSKADYLHVSITYAAGGLYSTVGDLYLWNQALYGGKVVSQESWDAMLDAAYTFPDGVQYGYGLVINNVADQPFIGHSGGINGYSSHMAYFTEENTMIILLENLEANPITLVNMFAQILFED